MTNRTDIIYTYFLSSQIFKQESLFYLIDNRAETRELDRVIILQNNEKEVVLPKKGVMEENN